LILLEAPAGFGKTYALAQWCERARKSHRTIAWINLQSTERFPAALASRVLDALGNGGLRNLPAAPAADTSAADPDRIVRFVSAFSTALSAHRRRILLVLDDYQTIEGGASDEWLGQIFEHLPANLCVALATRRACPIPVAKVLLQRRLQRLDKRSLFFTKSEAQAFFGGSLRPAQLSRLHSLTEGWPAALEMARVCLPEWQKAQIDILNIAEFSRLFGDYCASEVLRYATPQAVDLLIECSVAETLEPALCNAIRRQTDSAQILSGLTAHETFMEAVDVEANSWRLPRLLRRTLMRRAAGRGSDLLTGANLRAAEHCEAKGQTLAALHHYLDAHQPTSAAAALERANPLVITITRGDACGQELLDLIPHAEVQSFPRLGVCLAYLDFKQGLMDEARTQLTELATRTDNFTIDRSGGSDSQLKIESLCVELIMEFYSRSRAPLEYLHTLDRQMSVVSKGDARLVIIFRLVLGSLYKLRGDLETAETHFIQCEKLNARVRAPWTTVWLKYHYGVIALARGQLMEAKYHLQSGLKLWSIGFRSYPAYRAMAQLAIAEIDYETDALTEAQTRLDESLYTAEHVEGWFEPYAGVYEMKMMMHWHAGRLDEVESLLAHSVAIQRVDVLLESFLHVLKLRFELLRGRLGAAQIIIDTHRLDARWAASTFQDEFAYREWDLIGLCLCHLAIRRQSFFVASEVADRLDRIARFAGRRRTIAKASVLRAIIAHQQNDENQAVAHLQCALEIGHHQAYRRVFLDEAQLIHPVLIAVANRAGSVPAHLASYAQNLSNTLLEKDKEGVMDNACPLSERELEVLRELSQGRSNKMIARMLGLSTPTVSFHVRNIFQKLGVHRRASATAEALRRSWVS
jgi:LuxR family transcriptional regulator, maltose regulon positive regulatory protein